MGGVFNQSLIIFRFLILLTILLIVAALLRFVFVKQYDQGTKIVSPTTKNLIDVPQLLHEKYLKQKQLHDQWLENAKRLQYWSQQISNENRILKNRQKLTLIVRKVNKEEIKQRVLQEKRENVLEIKRFKSKINKNVVKKQKLTDNQSSPKFRRKK